MEEHAAKEQSWKLFDASGVINIDHEYWDRYLAARPKYSTSFYNQIFDYHSKNNSHRSEVDKPNEVFHDLAHDVGTGPGQVAAAICPQFGKVIATDSNTTHIEVAKHRNATLVREGKILPRLCSGEELGEHFAPSSADFIFAGESLALMNLEKTVNGFAKLLKPGGTLAVWYYGRPLFVEEPYQERCQWIYNQIANALFGRVLGKLAESDGSADGDIAAAMRMQSWKEATDMMASWLDDVRLAPDEWCNVERHKWNTHFGAENMTFYDASACPFSVEYQSQIDSRHEMIIHHQDPDFWAKQWTPLDVERFLDANLPGIKGEKWDEQVEKWLERLKEAMGGDGEEGRRKIGWPVVLILATRK